MSERIAYREGFKYQLAETYRVQIGIKPARDIVTEYVLLGTTGMLTIRSGYAWDGPSGPAMDTKSAMRGSLVHDALYQLIRLDYLSHDERERADREYRQICKEDGMWNLRAQYHFAALHLFGGAASLLDAEPPVLVAP